MGASIRARIALVHRGVGKAWFISNLLTPMAPQAGLQHHCRISDARYECLCTGFDRLIRA